MEPILTEITYELGTDGQTQFKVTTSTYHDGSIDITKKPYGTSDQIAYEKADEIENKINDLVEISQEISRINAKLKEIDYFDNDIKNQIGISPLDVIQKRYKDILLDKGWSIDNSSGYVSLDFSVNSSNVLKYSVNGTPNKNVKLYGNIIRLIDYPVNGINTDFFLSQTERIYFSLPNRSIKIKKP
jgi:hypothetical protein